MGLAMIWVCFNGMSALYQGAAFASVFMFCSFCVFSIEVVMDMPKADFGNLHIAHLAPHSILIKKINTMILKGRNTCMVAGCAILSLVFGELKINLPNEPKPY